MLAVAAGQGREPSRLLIRSLRAALQYRSRSASINSLRVATLICLVTLHCSRWTIRRIATYVRQRVSTGSNSDESMRRAQAASEAHHRTGVSVPVETALKKLQSKLDARRKKLGR